jgi:hypothetical protein
MSFLLGTTAMGEENKSESKVKAKRVAHEQQYRPIVAKARTQKVVVWSLVTDSRIPQRVVLRGQQVNSGSPVYMVQGDNELLRSGATSIIGILSQDPSITTRRGGGM